MNNADGRWNTLPQIKANMKSMRQDAAKRAANAAVKSQIHGAMKKAVAAANSDNKEEAFRAAVSIIDSAAQKGVIHKNAAARKKSRLNANVNAAIAKAKAAEAKEKAEAAKEEAKEAYKEKMEEKAWALSKELCPLRRSFFIAPNPASCAGIYFPKFYGLSPEWLTPPGEIQRFSRKYKAWVLQGSAAGQHIPCIIYKDEPLEILSFHKKKALKNVSHFSEPFFMHPYRPVSSR